MSRTVRVDSAASEEFTDATRWYEARRPGLGGQLHDGVVEAIATLRSEPDIGIKVGGDPMTRRILLRRFPYQIVYRLRPDEIVVVAVAHLKRRPGYWKSRP